MVRSDKTPFYILITMILLVGLIASACGGGGTQAPQPETDVTEEPAAPTPEPVETQAPATEPPATEPPTETQPPEEASGAVDSLQDAKNAIIQIEAQGTFVDPEFGLMQNTAGRGSGFIFDPSGLAVTNNHVVTGAALLKVWIAGEDEVKNAKVLGVSECSDLAVIDIEGDGYDYLEWYDGSIDAGMDLYVAGFPLGDPEYSLTKGIISKARASGETSWASVDSVVEYDATTNPGNSGGPVITPDGKVIAVHYAGDSSARQAFGISKDVAQDIIEDLKTEQNVDTIGVNGQAVASEDGTLTGIWVSSVQSGSPADKAGVEPGDILTMMENLVLATDGSMSQYCDILRSHSPGDTLSIQVLRFGTGDVLEGQLNGEKMVVVSTLGTEDTGTSSETTTTTGSAVYNPDASQSGDFVLSTEFDDTEGWYVFTVPENGDYEATYEDSRVYIQANDTDSSVYMVYDAFLPGDIQVDALVELVQGTNRNNISLVCRASEQGWYEFSMHTGGYWYIWKYEDGEYTELTHGASRAINLQKATNQLTATCIGSDLTFYVNDTELGSVRDNSHKGEGQVGVSVTTFDIPEVGVEFDWFVASIP